jgi:hypothetical protein
MAPQRPALVPSTHPLEISFQQPCCPPEGLIPAQLRRVLTNAVSWQAPATCPTEFAFEWSPEAAAHNFEILRKYHFDLASALDQQPYSALTIGSEFRSPSILAPIIERHPLWPKVHQMLVSGCDYALEPLTEAERLEDIRANMLRGNHQSAKQHSNRIQEMMESEVTNGWQLILPKLATFLLAGAVLGPLGIVSQETISERGEIISKWRLTHDQSFNVIPKTIRSVNDRVKWEELTPCMYGTALIRYIHIIVMLRTLHPQECILQTKVDWKSAYRRMHYSTTSAVQSMTLVDDNLLVALRMTFGGAPNPSQWSDVSELACDLANDLVRHPGWDPAIHSSPHQHLIAGTMDRQPGPVPFAPASPLFVRIPCDGLPKAENFIDDQFLAFLESSKARGSAVLPFVIHLLSRPVAANEAMARDDVLSLKKFLAEATPDEQKVILGWQIDTRVMTIALPEHKYIAWARSITDMLDSTVVYFPELETMIGRLNHAGFIIPNARHFLGRLRAAMYIAKKRRSAKLTTDQRADLRLWLRFLAQAQQGINLNNLTLRMPERIIDTDSCEHGIGGMNITSRFLWRWEIPMEFRQRTSLNSLEFLAAFVGLVMEFTTTTVPKQTCFLIGGDSTTATGWMRRSNFTDDDPVQLAVAREVATWLIREDCCLYSQWFPGTDNTVPDSLSRDHHLSTTDQLTLLQSHCPTQVPKDFEIRPVPPELVSTMMTWLRNLPASKQSPKVPHRSKLATGGTTSTTSNKSSSTATPSSMSSIDSTVNVCWERLQRPSVEMESKHTPMHQKRLLQCLVQSEPPSTLYHRPINSTSVLVPSMTKTQDNWPSFYSAS